MRAFFGVTASLACCFAAATQAIAQLSATDIQIAARALSFVENPPSGRVRVGIVYAPGNPRSAQQAEALRRLLGSGLRAGNVELAPVMLRVDQVDGAAVDVFFLAEQTSTADEGVAPAMAKRGKPCVTMDIEQVRNGACLMGVRSRPKVEILVNRETAAASGIAFATVFRVMITEI